MKNKTSVRIYKIFNGHDYVEKGEMCSESELRFCTKDERIMSEEFESIGFGGEELNSILDLAKGESYSLSDLSGIVSVVRVL